MTYVFVTIGILAALIITAWVRFNSFRREFEMWLRPQGIRWYLRLLKNRRKDRESIPVVAIDPEGGYKYVVISYRDKIYIRAQKEYEYHAGIVADFVYEVGDTKVQCLGGGTIKVDAEKRTVWLDGRSQGFGTDPDRKRSYALIEQFAGLKSPEPARSAN